MGPTRPHSLSNQMVGKTRMKQYPSIEGPNKAPSFPCIAFEKLDGSNLRWEWQRKRGFCKFGTRRRLFDETDPLFYQAIPIFFDEIADYMENLFKEVRTARGIVYTEFLGANSFAGNHVTDEEKYLYVFDIEFYKKGLVSPRDFLRHMRGAPFRVPRVVYEGNFNTPFIENVRNGHYNVNEGVVAKGTVGKQVEMRKVKTLAYLEKLKTFKKDSWRDYWE